MAGERDEFEGRRQYLRFRTSTLTISNVTAANVGNLFRDFEQRGRGAGQFECSADHCAVPAGDCPATDQPERVAGSAASFSVAAVGNTPYFYQWQFNGTNLANGVNFSGVTSSILTVSNVAPANAGHLFGGCQQHARLDHEHGRGVVHHSGHGAGDHHVQPCGHSAEAIRARFLYSPLAQGTDGNFYGTTLEGGADGDGTVFKYATQWNAEHLAFVQWQRRRIPYGGLCLGKDGYFYGAAYAGGTYGDGTTFRDHHRWRTDHLRQRSTGNNGEYPVAGHGRRA